MNENLNLVEILKDCPKGTKLYSPLYGDVELVEVSQDDVPHPIVIKIRLNSTESYWTDSFNKDGRIYAEYSGECMLFPSREQRDWSKFKVKKPKFDPKKPKFDPKTLCPFEKVLVRDTDYEDWSCGFFSHKFKNLAFPYRCMDLSFVFCIPYNEDTKHLVGTNKEAPEYYRYWED